MTRFLLVHGGLWAGEDAESFWHRPGVSAALRERGAEVLAPDRRLRAGSWRAEADWLATGLDGPVTVVAGSYGCSAAVRLALARPDLVARLVLAWPATAGDPGVDAVIREALADLGADPAVVAALLDGETLCGVTDAELRGLGMPVAVLPTLPENPIHRRRTADALAGLTGAEVLAGCSEPPRPEFQAGRFADSVVQFGLRRW